MTQKTGSASTIIAKKGSTFGTAVAASTGDKMIVEGLTRTENTAELSTTGIGSGLDMVNDKQTGAVSPTITINKNDFYDDAGEFLEALFFGGASVINMGSGGYSHSFLYNATRNAAFATVAFDGMTSVFEYPSCTPTKLSISADNPPNYVKKTIELLGNKLVTSAAGGNVNTAATLAAATVTDQRKIIVKPEDAFWINNRTGGDVVSTGTAIAIKSIKIDLAVPAQYVPEIKNSAGNGQPVLNGSPTFTGQVTIELKNLQDLTWFQAQANGTEYKAALVITDTTLIGGSIYYKKTYNFPFLKVIKDVAYDLNTTAENPATIVFDCIAATTAPTGMISTLPHVITQNTKSSAYL